MAPWLETRALVVFTPNSRMNIPCTVYAENVWSATQALLNATGLTCRRQAVLRYCRLGEYVPYLRKAIMYSRREQCLLDTTTRNLYGVTALL